MSEYIKILLKIIWLIVIVYWTISSFKVKNVKKTNSLLNNIMFYWLPLFVAVMLLGPGEWFGHTWLREQFTEHSDTVGLIGLLFSSVGAIISCRARYIIGNNWSLSVQQKENHELITNGIYKIVRHPIYLGLLNLFIGNAIIVGDYRAIIAVIIVFISFLIKIKNEEKNMIELFGEKYDKYKKETKALIPYIY